MLRYYQKEAIDSCFKWFSENKNKPLIVLPTGTGKSIVAASICSRVFEHNSGARIIVAAHVKELVEQNYNKLVDIDKRLPVGIVSAGLGRKEYKAPIIFGSIQSLYKQANNIGHVDLLIIDEGHIIPPKGRGMWRSFERDLTAINPNLKILGMTATPFRTTTGTLVGGSHPQFEGICYEYSIIKAIKEGFLSEITTIPTVTHLTTNGVKKRGGEFIASELEAAVNVDSKTKACCDEIISLGHDRETWLIFSSGNAHAEKIHEYLQSQGLHGYCLTEKTKGTERDEAIRKLTNGECRYIVNNMILTTGFDCPRLSLIACMRPTQSAGLWVQICGRGTRLFLGKLNCLLLDFGKNIDRHGAIDQISGSEYFEKQEKGEAPIKNCPECFAMAHASARFCPDCGFEFTGRDELSITRKASTGALLSYQNEPTDIDVIDMKVSRHIGRGGKPDSLKINYFTLMGDVAEFLFYDHPAQSYPYQQAVKAGGHYPSVSKALEGEWIKPNTIKIIKEKKYFKVLTKNYN